MNKEELLNPRYKVIADWPGNPFKVGDILVRIKYATNDIFHTDEDAPVGGIYKSEIEKYQHLFKKLEWWEERELPQLPEYIRFDYGKHFNSHLPTGKENIGRVWKVQKWDLNMINQPMCHDKNKDGNDFLSIEWHFYKNSSTPATEEEYLNQNKTV